jgi:uncharacterized protein YndB with AHSA1/START domain
VATRTDGLTLELERVLPAARPRVYELFTDPDELTRWWGPEGFSTPSLEFEPRVGEGFRIEMQPPEGDAFQLTGEFRAVDPPARLTFTFRGEPPDPDDVETLVELSFRELDRSTEVELIQGSFKTEARRALHRDGWTDSFNRLEAVL